jgi:hypothetical protein
MRKNEIRLKNLGDCRRFLARVANDLHRGDMEMGKARSLTYVISELRATIKDGDLESRLEQLEQDMEGRR